ncbi:hypothetical protein ACI65C_001471 [Semiaphis heraclei]
MSPLALCLLDGNCAGVTFTSVQGIYSRMIAVACFLSFSTLLLKYCSTMPGYVKNIEAYDLYSPTTDTEHRNRSLYHLFLTVLYLSVILPTNILRLSILYRNDSDVIVLIFFVFMYLENIGMSMVETFFIIHCRTLENKFFKINRDFERLGREIVHTSMSIVEKTSVAVGHRVVYDGDFYGSNDHSVANAVEIIRIRHRLIRDAVYVLANLFGIPMGLSLFTLCVMTLFDIYYQALSIMGVNLLSPIFLYICVISVAHNNWQKIYSMLLIMSCVYVFYTTPQIVCILEGNCDDSLSTFVKGMFARLVALTCMISRCVIFVKGKTQLAICILLTVPVNVCRLWILYDVAKQTVPFVALVYVQNFSMYCIEAHFTVLCYILYQKIVGINNDLMALKVDTIVRNKYPFVSLTGEKYGKNNSTNEYNREVFHSLIAGYPMIDFLENLKAKHKLVSQAVKNLNNTFGIHLGLSLCALCLYTLFDLYYHLQAVWKHSKYKILVYGWILQYFVRFLFITVLAHVTTKQALKSKILLTDINNRYLDNNTKEELQLFLNQISSCTIEFTACDFFTLNTHLITSVS